MPRVNALQEKGVISSHLVWKKRLSDGFYLPPQFIRFYGELHVVCPLYEVTEREHFMWRKSYPPREDFRDEEGNIRTNQRSRLYKRPLSESVPAL